MCLPEGVRLAVFKSVSVALGPRLIAACHVMPPFVPVPGPAFTQSHIILKHLVEPVPVPRKTAQGPLALSAVIKINFRCLDCLFRRALIISRVRAAPAS